MTDLRKKKAKNPSRSCDFRDYFGWSDLPQPQDQEWVELQVELASHTPVLFPLRSREWQVGSQS